MKEKFSLRFIFIREKEKGRDDLDFFLLLYLFIFRVNIFNKLFSY